MTHEVSDESPINPPAPTRSEARCRDCGITLARIDGGLGTITIVPGVPAECSISLARMFLYCPCGRIQARVIPPGTEIICPASTDAGQDARIVIRWT